MALVADVVVDRLARWGVRRVFGYPGDGIDPLMAALARSEQGPEFVTARHEEMAAFMASGHAKYAGEVGVCLVTQGPGAIHLLTGLYDAKLDRQPVVAIVGQAVSTALGNGYLQEVDLHTLFKDACGQYVQTVSTPQRLPLVLDNAVRTAISTSSPTCVILPHDVQLAEVDVPPSARGVTSPPAVADRPRVVPAAERIEQAAAVLAAGSRVALLVGRGAQGAGREVVELAERLGAGITTSLLGKPVLDERLPFHCGVMGHLGTTAAAELMQACDTLLIIGSNDPWTESYPAPGQARTVQIDIEARNLGAKTEVEVALCGDARRTLAELIPMLDRAEDRTWCGQVEEWVRAWRELARIRVNAPAAPLNPQRVVHELSARLPHDAQIAVDVGSVTYWYARYVRLPAGVPAHLSSTLASMGSALPYGLAAKFHDPSRPVIALAGDGAMQMNGLLELITVARHWRSWPDPRFVVLVLNNGDLAEVSWEPREADGDPRWETSQRVPAFPYARYAELLGLRGIRVGSPERIGDAWDHALERDRPCLIEAMVDPDVPLPAPPRPGEQRAREPIPGSGGS